LLADRVRAVGQDRRPRGRGLRAVLVSAGNLL